MHAVTAIASRPSGRLSAGLAAGLTAAEAARRAVRFGPNEIRRAAPVSRVTILLRQFASPVIGLLLGAAGVSLLLGEPLDAGAIAVIVILNAIIGFLQEHRAERAVMALQAMTAPRARVSRSLLYACAGVVGLVAVVGVLRGWGVLEDEIRDDQSAESARTHKRILVPGPVADDLLVPE
jgi:magnesium-transporting ATPase (P-type)